MRRPAIAFAALTCIWMPGLAFAQQTPSPPMAAETPADVNQVGGDEQIQSFDTFLKGFANADFSSAMSDLAGASTFHVIRISEMENADSAQLESALAGHEQGLTELREAIAGTQGAVAALEEAGASPDQVVWIATEEEGELALYVTDLG